MFTSDEFEIITFLKCFKGQYVSGKEVCRRAGSKRRYQENPRWALPLLVGMVVRGIVTVDAGGHYRLLEKEEQPNRNVGSPAISSASDPAAAPPTELQELEVPKDDDGTSEPTL